MAMTMNGQVQLAASRDVVWAKLNDPEVLKSCIPGSEQLDKILEDIRQTKSCCCLCTRCDIGNHCMEEGKGCRMG